MKRLFFLLSVFTGACIHFNAWAVEGGYDYYRAPIKDYITGDAFRSISHYVYEIDNYYRTGEPSAYDPNMRNCNPGDIIFVQGYLLDKFIEEEHPKIKNPYFLIVHNSDLPIPSRYLPYLNDPKVIRCFAQNVDCRTDKIIPIPIGLENRFWWHVRGNHESLYEDIKSEAIDRDEKVYLNFQIATFARERGGVHDRYSTKDFVSKTDPKSVPNYLRDLRSHWFCLSPSGAGIDCHRTWEALMMGAIPIVRPCSSFTLKFARGNKFLYEDLPVIVVKDWRVITRGFLLKEKERIQNSKINYEKMYFPYWKNLIMTEVRAYKSSLGVNY